MQNSPIDPKAALDDLAFMRAIVDEQGQVFAGGGIVYFAAGLLYGLQSLGLWLGTNAIIPVSDFGWMLISIAPTLAFIGILVWALSRDRKTLIPKGIASRAISALFSGVGLATLAMAMVFGMNAYMQDNFQIWLYFPIVVCAFQGAAWYAIALIRRRLWMGFTAAGWFATAVLAGLFVNQQLSHYTLVLTISMFAFMAVPGFLMMRTERPAK